MRPRAQTLTGRRLADREQRGRSEWITPPPPALHQCAKKGRAHWPSLAELQGCLLLSRATFAVGRIPIAPLFALPLCPLAIRAGAFFPARVAIAALGPRAIGNDLGVESGFAGKVGSRGIPQITCISRTGSDRGAHQGDEC